MDRLLKNKTPLLFYGNGTVPPLEDYGWSIICRNTADDTARILKNKEIELILVDAADFVPELKPVLDTVDTPLVFLVSDDNPELLQSVDGFDCSCVLDGASSPAVLDLSLRRLLKNNCRRYENEFENARIMLNDVLNTIPVRVFWKDLNSTYLAVTDSSPLIRENSRRRRLSDSPTTISDPPKQPSLTVLMIRRLLKAVSRE